jgi:TPP-dependent pyruvate/acetoin dehydrogenase alpha subunit
MVGMPDQQVRIATKVIPETLPREKLRDMLLKMLLIRTFEETAEQLYMMGKVHGTMHLSIGQEGTAVGAMAAL